MSLPVFGCWSNLKIIGAAIELHTARHHATEEGGRRRHGVSSSASLFGANVGAGRECHMQGILGFLLGREVELDQDNVGSVLVWARVPLKAPASRAEEH